MENYQHAFIRTIGIVSGALLKMLLFSKHFFNGIKILAITKILLPSTLVIIIRKNKPGEK